MKTILIATDFSKTALNAADYAAEMAVRTKAKLVLYHAFHLPMTTTEVPVAVISIEEMEKDCMQALQKYATEIRAKYGNEIQVDCKCSCGFAAEEIDKIARECKADLVVMGMRGASVLAEKFLGSVTTTVIKKTNYPVLIINEHVKFRNIKKIALACDYSDLHLSVVFNPLKEIARLFKANVYALNVVKELEPITTPKAVEGLRLEHALEGIDHSYHFVYNDDVVDGIDAFVIEQQMDMLVMIPHDKGVWGNLFKTHHTKKEAFHTRIPLLSIRG